MSSDEDQDDCPPVHTPVPTTSPSTFLSLFKRPSDGRGSSTKRTCKDRGKAEQSHICLTCNVTMARGTSFFKKWHTERCHKGDRKYNPEKHIVLHVAGAQSYPGSSKVASQADCEIVEERGEREAPELVDKHQQPTAVEHATQQTQHTTQHEHATPQG